MKIIMYVIIIFILLSCEKNDDNGDFICLRRNDHEFPSELYNKLPDIINLNENLQIIDTIMLGAAYNFEKFNKYYSNDTIILQMELCFMSGDHIQTGVPKHIEGDLKFEKIGDFYLFNLIKRGDTDSLIFIKNIKVE